MILKKTVTTLILFVSLASVNAQYFYWGAEAGYSIGGFFKSNFPLSYYKGDYYVIPSQKNVKVRYSLGNGFQVQLFTGYQFKSRFGIELSGAYFIGHSFIYDSKRYGQPTSSGQYIKVRGSLFKLTPMIKYTICKDENSFFIKAGPIIGIGNGRRYDELSMRRELGPSPGSGSEIQTDTYLWDLKGGLCYGGRASFGMNFPLSKSAILFLDGGFNYLRWAVKETVLEEYNGNKDHEFDVSLIKSDRQRLSFHGFSFNVGVQFNFDKSEK